MRERESERGERERVRRERERERDYILHKVRFLGLLYRFIYILLLILHISLPNFFIDWRLRDLCDCSCVVLDAITGEKIRLTGDESDISDTKSDFANKNVSFIAADISRSLKGQRFENVAISHASSRQIGWQQSRES